MLNFRLHIYRGLPWVGKEPAADPDRVFPHFFISASSVDIAGEYAGSGHVLEMGRHFTAYASYGASWPRFGFPVAMPAWNPAPRLMWRGRAADVTGNIGEIITGIVAKQVFRANVFEIAHLEARRDGRTPDYLIVNSEGVRTYVADFVDMAESDLPFYWPVESKAWSRPDGQRDAIRDALRQLADFWLDTRQGNEQGVGYGVIVGVQLAYPRTISVYILVPKSAASLLAWFVSVEVEAGNKKSSPREVLRSRLSGKGIAALIEQISTW